ncbi:hypothetical protein ONS95_002362 [Cadophora gregata]|uniref:uncharacterized protein n=1 Tax=Cadophora gregata TaxID=51156 RepID=UPI0026DC45B0|nr:uncharacterized protein ONS95_002362 [Cadophora gregata]KAK0109683.1 hypothetical protein ONS95_002362 [Cadophora gregata]KAK0110686.1 hypothetical protein ONS96_002288 [Cadophora gregata f. sp. sojae]
MNSQYSSGSWGSDCAVGYPRIRSSTKGDLHIERSTTPKATENSPVGHKMTRSTLVTSTLPVKSQDLAPESSDINVLQQENAALLAKVAALESTAKLQHRILLYVYQERTDLTKENGDLHYQLSYLEHCLQEARIKYDEMADKVGTLEWAELAKHHFISGMRQKNSELVTEVQAVRGHVGILKEALQTTYAKGQETARQLHLAKSGFAKRLKLIQTERGSLRRRTRQDAQERREFTKQIDGITTKYQNAARSQIHILQSYKATIQELEAVRADHADEKERHEETWRLMAKWTNLRTKRHSDIMNQLQKEVDAKSLKIREQSQTIQQHSYIIDEVCHILNSLSPELKEAIKEENRILKEREFEGQDNEDDTCSNCSDSAETVIYSPKTESAGQDGSTCGLSTQVLVAAEG